jgi:hypothetical protein
VVCSTLAPCSSSYSVSVCMSRRETREGYLWSLVSGDVHVTCMLRACYVHVTVLLSVSSTSPQTRDHLSRQRPETMLHWSSRSLCRERRETMLHWTMLHWSSRSLCRTDHVTLVLDLCVARRPMWLDDLILLGDVSFWYSFGTCLFMFGYVS